jgi:hypothetical protein
MVFSLVGFEDASYWSDSFDLGCELMKVFVLSHTIVCTRSFSVNIIIYSEWPASVYSMHSCLFLPSVSQYLRFVSKIL